MIVLISGKQRSGKDSLAEELDLYSHQAFIDKFYPILKVSFAAPIKTIVSAIEDRLGPLDVAQRSRMAQIIGTEIGRELYGDDIWIRKMRSQIGSHRGLYSSDVLFLITDCRFKNEFEAFPEALRVRLTCPENIRKARSEGKWRDTTDHISETDLDDYERLGLFDLVIDTSKVDSKGAAELVRAQLLKNSWMEKRKKA